MTFSVHHVAGMPAHFGQFCPTLTHRVFVAAFLLCARSNQERLVATVKRGRILAFIDSYAEKYGQHMPNKRETYLYLRNKKARRLASLYAF